MENRPENSVSKINRFSIFSVMAGLLSLLLYLPDLLGHNISHNYWDVPSPVVWHIGEISRAIVDVIPNELAFGIIFLGVIGLFFTFKALRLIKEGSFENRYRVMPITGMFLSILGIISIILPILFLGNG